MRKTMLTSTAVACLLVGSQFALAQSSEPRRDEQKQERIEKNAPASTQEHRPPRGGAEPSRAQTETPRSSPKAAEEGKKPSSAGQSAQEPNRAATERKTEQSGSSKEAERSKPTSSSDKTQPSQQKTQQHAPSQPSSAQSAKPNNNANNTNTNTTPPTAQQPSTAQQPTAQHPTAQQPTAQQPNRAASPNAPQQTTTTTTTQQRNPTTTSANTAQLAPEKQRRITETIQRTRVAPPVRNLNVNISVGTPVPRYVRVYRLPQEIVLIEPQYRGYDYFTTEEDIVIVEPRSHRVVSMVPRRVQTGGEQIAQGSTTMTSAGGPPPCRIMRREPNGQVTELNPADLSRSTVGSGGQRSFPIAVSVQTGNGQSTQLIPLDAPAGQIVVATQGNGDCEITIEPQPPR